MRSEPSPIFSLSPSSFHVGCEAKDPQSYLSALKMAHQMFVFGESLGYRFTLLDIGGGFPGGCGFECYIISGKCTHMYMYMYMRLHTHTHTIDI